MKGAFVKTAAKVVGRFKAFGLRLRELLMTVLIVKKPNINSEFNENSLVSLVEKAKTEWEQAKVFFNEAQDPALIDHAIYAMVAAERKYMYLLKEARQEKVVHEDIYYVLNNHVS